MPSKIIYFFKLYINFIILFCITIECKDTVKGLDYIGSLNTTKSGKSCQRWDSDTPHNTNKNEVKKGNFPEKSIASAGNKCRNLVDNDSPWCYTTDPATRWEYCDVPMCDGE